MTSINGKEDADGDGTSLSPDDRLRHERAMGRWKLLRAALLGQEPQVTTTNSNEKGGGQRHSIHRFEGYKLLSSVVVSLTSEEGLYLRDCLRRYAAKGENSQAIVSVSRWRLCLTALRALAPHQTSIQVPIAAVDAINEKERNQITQSLCQDEGINLLIDQCEWTRVDDDSKNDRKQQQHHHHRQQWTLTVHWKQQPHPWQYHIQRYDGIAPTLSEHDSDHTGRLIYIHERLPASQRKLTVRDLTSHRHQQQVDNTGNICVWDCEKTLTWFLHQQQDMPPPGVVLEVGVGMAGLAALSLYGIAQQIYLTDGHEDCVWNNRVNLALAQATIMAQGNNVNDDNKIHSTAMAHCQVLRWNYDATPATRLQADWTLVSDCTHFQEWHGQLLWTLLWHTRVGGCIWMCQPNRGKSWMRFEKLIQIVSEQSSEKPLVDVKKETNATLEEKHAHCLNTDSNYLPDIHQPRIFLLQVLRQVTLHDQETIQRHIESRDMKEG